VFAEDTFDQALLFHALEAVLDLELVRHEQRISALEGDPDLNTGKPAGPTEDDPPDRASHAALFEDKDGNGRKAAGLGHDWVNFIILSSRPATRS
jgi:hypothetical protein